MITLSLFIQKVFFYLAYFFILIGISLCLYIYYLFFFPFATVQVFNNPAPVLTKVIHPGEQILYQVKFCKYTDLKGTITQSLVDHLVILLPNSTSQFPKGCATRIFSLETSGNLLPGTYYIVVTYKYQVNALREIDTTFQTQEFEVK